MALSFTQYGDAFEQDTLQALPATVDTALLGVSPDANWILRIAVAPGDGVHVKTNSALTGSTGSSNGIFIPGNSVTFIKFRPNEAINWQHAGAACLVNFSFGVMS
jgi:hypothetical protein